MAMQYHPDRNKGDKKAEEKFKEINEAYQTLSDATKKRNYDQFGSAEGNPFSNMWGSGNPFWSGTRASSGGSFWWFEDLFSQFGGWGGGTRGGFEFDLGDILSGMGSSRSRQTRYEDTDPYEEPKKVKVDPELDVTETVEIPFLDFLYDTSLDIRTVYGKHLTLKIKAGTKPWTKFKISWKWRVSDGKTGDMYVIVDAKMPKDIPESLRPMIDALRSQI